MSETSADANRLVEEFYGGEASNMRYTDWDVLIAECDSLKAVDRNLCRQLCVRLSRRDPAIAERLLNSRKHTIQHVLSAEPLWAIALTWLPTLAVIQDKELRSTLTSSAITGARLARQPESFVDLILWIEIYGVAPTKKYLSDRLATGCLGQDPDRIERLAQMIAQLPERDKRSFGRVFCRLLVHLPENVLYGCINHRNAFSLLVSMLADYGGPVGRRIALREIGAFVAFQEKEKLLVPQPWIESFARLIDRTFRQERNRLSLQFVSALLARQLNTGFRTDYEECFLNETGRAIHPLFDQWVRIFDDLATEQAEELGTVQIAANALPQGSAWADDDDWEKLLTHYLAAIRSISEKVPVDRLAPLLLPALSAVRSRSSRDLCERFLKIILKWVPRTGVEATLERAKFTIRLLSLVFARAPTEEIGARAKAIFLNLLIDPSEAYREGIAFYEQLLTHFNLDAISIHPEMGVPPTWVNQPGLANEYLVRTAVVSWSQAEQGVLAERVTALWRETSGCCCQSCRRISEVESASRGGCADAGYPGLRTVFGCSRAVGDCCRSAA